MSKAPNAEIIIVGAGPAGSTLARELARRGRDVLLLERSHFPRPKTCGDGLTPRAVAVMQRLGIENAVQAAGAFRVEQAALVGPRGEFMRMPFHGLTDNLPGYGYVLPRLILDDLLRRAAQNEGARLQQETKVVGPLFDDHKRVSGVEMLQNGHLREARAPLTVLATGVSLPLLKAFGFLQALPPVVRAIRGYWQDIADLIPQLEFYFTVLNWLPGYAWLFPTGEGQANIGLGVFPQTLRLASRLNVRALLEHFLTMESSLHDRLKGATLIGKLAGYPLRTDFPAMPLSRPGCTVVGEAAGLVNPITGEGIDLAMESGELAAQVLAPTLRHRRLLDVGVQFYAAQLRWRYELLFKGLRILLRRAMVPRALSRIIRQGNRHPALAKQIAGINLGVTSPYTAFLPSTRYYLRK